jgi:hypothetical protein
VDSDEFDIDNSPLADTDEGEAALVSAALHDDPRHLWYVAFQCFYREEMRARLPRCCAQALIMSCRYRPRRTD